MEPCQFLWDLLAIRRKKIPLDLISLDSYIIQLHHSPRGPIHSTSLLVWRTEGSPSPQDSLGTHLHSHSHLPNSRAHAVNLDLCSGYLYLSPPDGHYCQFKLAHMRENYLLILTSPVFFLAHANETSKCKRKNIFEKGTTSSSAYNFSTFILKTTVELKDQIDYLSWRPLSVLKDRRVFKYSKSVFPQAVYRMPACL